MYTHLQFRCMYCTMLYGLRSRYQRSRSHKLSFRSMPLYVFPVPDAGLPSSSARFQVPRLRNCISGSWLSVSVPLLLVPGSVCGPCRTFFGSCGKSFGPVVHFSAPSPYCLVSGAWFPLWSMARSLGF